VAGAVGHLDVVHTVHHDVNVRTTLTLDDDVATQLREEAARQRLPFKQVVNKVIRLGLRASSAPGPRAPFRVRARRLGLQPGIDPDKLGQLADELETQAFAAQQTLPRAAVRSRQQRRE
jgi:hypothetical protein